MGLVRPWDIDDPGIQQEPHTLGDVETCDVIISLHGTCLPWLHGGDDRVHHGGVSQPIRREAGPWQENRPESFRQTRRKSMEVENKLKAMGLELPAAGTPPPGRAGAVKIGTILFVGRHTPGPAYRGKLGAGFTVEQGYDGARQACLNC